MSRLLNDLGHADEYEKHLHSLLERYNPSKSRKRQGNDHRHVEKIVQNLCELYFSQGQFQDIIKTWEEAPLLNKKDLRQIVSDSWPQSWKIASILMVQKEKPELAVPILKQRLAAGTERYWKLPLDPLFERLAEIAGLDAIPFLDSLSLRDPIDERPLLWKAKILLDEEELQEAEQLARRAIYLAPSDKESLPGHRMKAHAVLSEILSKAGETDEAVKYNGMVEAIRLAEKGDELFELGMLDGAIEYYQQAVRESDQIHKVHIELGMLLTTAGFQNEAAAHFRKATELLPNDVDFDARFYSFPYILEKGIKGVPSIDEVLSEMIQKGDKRPATHFLLGRWQLKEGKDEEALRSFNKAVELEPDFMPAWDQIIQLERKLEKPMGKSAQSLLRLYPTNREILWMDDFELLWQLSTEAIERINQHQIHLEAWSYPIGQEKSEPDVTPVSYLDYLRKIGRKVSWNNPADILGSQQQIKDICRFISAANMPVRD